MSHDFDTDLFFSSSPPFPPCLLLFLSTQLQGCSTEESWLLLGPAPTAAARVPSLVPTQPNSDRISHEATASRAPISPHRKGPYLTLASEISLDPYSITRQKPSSGTVPMAAMLLRLREVARSLPSSIHPHRRCAGCERGRARSPPSPVPCLWFCICLIQPFWQGVWGGGEHANSMEARRDLGLFKNINAHTEG